MKKLKMQTPDLTEENINKIQDLFPNVIKEIEDENGEIKKGIDFDILKQELSEDVTEGFKERYSLSWPGKSASILKANTPIKNKTLRPVKEDSEDFDNTENLYLEGDNFEILKLLQESYSNKIKMIYIDPPYNTGKDFVYKDSFKQKKEDYDKEINAVDDDGNKLFKENTKTNPRYHSDWLSMMYERLVIARDLLKDDGVIFISIDDNEVHNLRKICDEIFGEGNFISNFVWQKNFAPKNDNKYISTSHEYILLFSKEKDKFKRNLLPREEKHNKGYANPDNDERGVWSSGTILATTFSQNGVFEIQSPKGTKHLPPAGRCWRYSLKKIKELIQDNRLWFGKDGKGVPRVKRFLSEMPEGIVPQTLLKYEEVGSGQDGTKDLKNIFNDTFLFDFPKPLKLLDRIIKIVSNKNDLILDFFSGSATTAHAVMQSNAEGGVNRKYIMVQIPEEVDEKSEGYKFLKSLDKPTNICEIGKERIRRASKKIKEDFKEKDLSNLDFGFRVFKVDSTNMKEVYYNPSKLKQSMLEGLESNIKDDRTAEDLLTQVMLDLGLELSHKIETREIKGHKVFFVSENSLVACFDEKIDLSIVEEISKVKPLRVVFRDSSFKDDKDRINLGEKFKILSPETDIRVI